MLVFYCGVKNYHKIHSLKQYPFIRSQFCRLELQVKLIWVLCSGTTRLVSGSWPSCFLIWTLRSSSNFRCLRKNLVSCDYRMEVPVSLFQSAKHCSQQLEVANFPCQMAPGISKPSNGDTLSHQIPFML